MNPYIEREGMSISEFFNGYQKLINHRVSRNAGPNYEILESYILSSQEYIPAGEDIIKKVSSTKSSANVEFFSYQYNERKDKVEKHRVLVNYKVVKSKKDRVETFVYFSYPKSKMAISLVKFLGLRSYIIPKKQVMSVIYDREKEILKYRLDLWLEAKVEDKLLKEDFKKTFEKAKVISIEKIIPIIMAQ